MKRLSSLLLFFALTAILAGALLYQYRAVLIPFGILLLFIGYILEKVVLRPQKYRLSEMSPSICARGLICGETDEIMITDKWERHESNVIMLSQFEGEYKVCTTELSRDNFSLIAKIVLERAGVMKGESVSGSAQIHVETGWLLFMLGSNLGLLSSRKTRDFIQGSLKRLPDNEVFFLWLKNGSGKNVGLVISSGEGDGTYTIKYSSINNILTTIEANFIGVPRSKIQKPKSK